MVFPAAGVWVLGLMPWRTGGRGDVGSTDAMAQRRCPPNWKGRSPLPQRSRRFFEWACEVGWHAPDSRKPFGGS